MYPTISDLIYDFTGLHIPMGIQSFGFFMAMSFLFGGYAMSLELKRKEKLSLLKSFTKKTLVGKPITTTDLALNAFWGFVIGYKLLFIILNYSSCSDNPQGTIFSLQGNFIGGIVGAVISGYLKYREQQKTKAEKEKWIEEEVHPYQLIGNITMVAAVAGLIGAKIFHNLENIDEFMADPVGSLISFSGLTFYGGLIIATISVLYYGKKITFLPFIS